uniref:Uncharacterized protein n=1 Tax=Panagrellus redivivus TaxID=6233 RepID=A0A7E5A0Y1_PANRE
MVSFQRANVSDANIIGMQKHLLFDLNSKKVSSVRQHLSFVQNNLQRLHTSPRCGHSFISVGHLFLLLSLVMQTENAHNEAGPFSF